VYLSVPKLKRIKPPKGFTVEQFAWAVAKKIGKEGQRFRKPYPFIQPALAYTINKNLEGIATAAAVDITTSIQNTINKTANLK